MLEEKIFKSIFHLKKNLTASLIFPLLLFIFLYAWHPFILGYYSDDWGYIFRPGVMNFASDNLTFFISSFANRPISGFIYFLASYVCQWNEPSSWHVFILFLLCLNIIALRGFFINLFKFLGFDNHIKYSDISLSFWLASPWIVGQVVWISPAINSISILLFSLSGWILLNSWNKGKSVWLMPSIFYMLSCLSYEIFYLQFIILILIGWHVGINKKIGRKTLLKTIIAFIFAMILAILWNRISIMLFSTAVHKPFNPYWLQIFAANLISLPYALFRSMREMTYILLPVSAMATILFIYFHFKTKYKVKTNINFLIILLILFCGIVLTLLIISFPGYTIWAMGAKSRLLMSSGIWLAVVFTVIYYNLSKIKNLKVAYIKAGATIVILCLSIANISGTLDWARAWILQKSVIKSIPIEEISKTASSSVIIFDGPFQNNYVPVFDADWAINVQMNLGRKLFHKSSIYEDEQNSYRLYTVGRGIIHPLYNTQWLNIWDGNKLIQTYKNKNIKSPALPNGQTFKPERIYTAKEVWVWEYGDDNFYQLKSPSELILKQYKNYDYWLTYLWNNYF